MNKIIGFLSFLLLISIVYYSFFSMMPRQGTDATTASTEFSTQRARVHLKEISQEPHYYGSVAHAEVRAYLKSQLQSLGAETEIQEGILSNLSYQTFTKNDTVSYPSGYYVIHPQNILARIKGSNPGKALLLLSHYDSALVPSLGASDAGSGVVTILESLRAYLASGKTPKNDIIILFTDAEEHGLDGASLFVNEHPWAKDVGLVLNFEARGSGGPSNMILETNQGNSNLIKEFIKANPQYPVASSLMYSIYKMLPNDTDSTVFREDGDIDSYFFAFIDDHYDYHTANDNYKNLDDETLQHQGTYLLPLIHYFAEADLTSLKADTDNVYVNFPIIKMINYPFSWIIWMLLAAVIIFIVLLFYGFSIGKLTLKSIGKGFLSFLSALLLCGFIGFFGWKLLLWLYPHYNEIQHGFTYNGHSYIAFFTLLSLAILFKTYKKFGKKDSVASLYVAPLTLWIILNAVIFVVLKGAAYFIIPVLFGLISFWLLIKQERPSLFLLTFLSAPAIILFAPLIQSFPVGLGLKMLVISCVFTVLTFGLVFPVVGQYQWKNILAAICFILSIIYFTIAHFDSEFSDTRQKPNSLVYYENVDTKKSFWVTYDDVLDEWTQSYLGESPEDASKFVSSSAGSKYNTGYTYAAPAPFKDIEPSDIFLVTDTLYNGTREVAFTISPQRYTNRIFLYTDKDSNFLSFEVNGTSPQPSSEINNFQNTRFHDNLVRYFVNNNEPLRIRYTIEDNQAPTYFTVLEYSYDLLTHPKFSISKRPSYTMPKPFVVTDAIVQKRSFAINELRRRTVDSIPDLIVSTHNAPN